MNAALRPALTFNEAAHTYHLDGKRVPSVTQVLQPLTALFYPDMNSPQMQAARIRGQHVHAACHYEDEGDLDISTIGAYAGYVKAWQKFKAEKRAEILVNESRVVHRGMRYAGTLDKLALIDDALWLLDLKSALHMIPPYGPQTAAYLMALIDEGIDERYPREWKSWIPTVHTRRACVLLDSEGRYQFKEIKTSLHDDFAIFLAQLTTHNWKEIHCPSKA